MLNRRELLRRSIGVAPGILLGTAASNLIGQTKNSVLDQPWAKTDEVFTKETLRAINLGLHFLSRSQLNSGRFPERMGANVAVVSLAGLAWLAAGYLPNRGKYGVHLRRAIDFVASSRLPNGMLMRAESASRGAMYGHGFATLFLAEAYGMSLRSDLQGILLRAVQLIVQSQNQEGGWRYRPMPDDADVSVSVCQMMALRAAKNAGVFVPGETIRKATEYLRRCQNPDGGFAYQATGTESRFPLTAGAIVALQNAGRYRGKELESAYDFLLRRGGGNLRPRQSNYFFYAHYYSVQAFWQRGGKAFADWYGDLRDVLLPMQSGQGDWPDYVGTVYATAMACIILSAPRTHLPIFQR